MWKELTIAGLVGLVIVLFIGLLRSKERERPKTWSEHVATILDSVSDVANDWRARSDAEQFDTEFLNNLPTSTGA